MRINDVTVTEGNTGAVAANFTVTLSAASSLAGNPPGTCLRRWDGQQVGASAAVSATLAGADVGIAFTANPGNYEVGDWWGARVRGSAADAVETLTAAPPDGILHALTPLAVVDLSQAVVLTDCRPTFLPLTEVRSTCTVTCFPGDDLQAGLDALPASGGELCLAAGTYLLPAPLTLTDKRRIVVTGVGPSTVLSIGGHEAALIATRCDDIEVTRLRVEAGQPASNEKHLLGGLSFLGGDGTRVVDCEISCPDSTDRAQSGIYVAPSDDGLQPAGVHLSGNHLYVGDQQTGILVVSAYDATVTANVVELAPLPVILSRRPTRLAARQLGRYVAAQALAESSKAACDQAGRQELAEGRRQRGRETTGGRLRREHRAPPRSSAPETPGPRWSVMPAPRPWNRIRRSRARPARRSCSWRWPAHAASGRASSSPGSGRYGSGSSTTG